MTRGSASTANTPEPGRLAPGETVGSYVVVSHVGTGDFASVYRVERDGREVALKLAHSERSSARERLGIEAEALKELSHPSIPRFIDADLSATKPYLVMELARGHTIRERLRDRQHARAVAGDIEALQVLVALLEGLAHIHNTSLVHRDIKDANVTFSITTQELKILDFGFCKRSGERDTRLDDSFFRAGAVRFSPPSKIQNPGIAVAAHDVFAAGVLAYLQLTGVHPWSVPPGQDIGSFARHQLEHDPQTVRQRNSRAHPELDRLVMRLIDREDARRPSAEEAAAEARTLLAELDTSPLSDVTEDQVRFTRVTRDPLYGDVRLTEAEREVLNVPEVQRLRLLKQLGLTNMVYLGAEHTRLAHAVGCVFRVEQILRAIEDTAGIRIDASTRLIARMYALVHDVTHVAYGHTVEDELGIYRRHDTNPDRTERLLLSDQSRLGTILRSSEIGREVLKFFDPDSTIHARSSVKDLVTSSTGADVLDYIDRDAYYCGLDHRVDSAIFRQFRLTRTDRTSDERLVSLLYSSAGIRLDREFAVESLLTERYAMFLKVYTHHRKAAASVLLGKALGAAAFPASGKPDFSEDEYEWMSDAVVVDRLRRSRKPSVRSQAERLSNRQLPREVFRAHLLGEPDRTEDQYRGRVAGLQSDGLFDPLMRRELEGRLARKAALSPRDVYIYCPPKAPGYQRVRHVISARPGASIELDPVSGPYHRIRRKHLGLWELIVFSADADRATDAKLADEARTQFGLENEIASDVRSGRLF